MADVHFCTVTDPNGLHIRTQPTTTSVVVWTAAPGTTLNYTEVVEREDVEGNPSWGHSVENHYYWMGGTDYSHS
jgi:hypothetical protein